MSLLGSITDYAGYFGKSGQLIPCDIFFDDEKYFEFNLANWQNRKNDGLFATIATIALTIIASLILKFVPMPHQVWIALTVGVALLGTLIIIKIKNFIHNRLLCCMEIDLIKEDDYDKKQTRLNNTREFLEANQFAQLGKMENTYYQLMTTMYLNHLHSV